jgi:hypothetical protein
MCSPERLPKYLNDRCWAMAEIHFQTKFHAGRNIELLGNELIFVRTHRKQKQEM